MIKEILEWFEFKSEEKVSPSTRARGRRMLSEGVQPEREKENHEVIGRGFYLGREEDFDGE
jgi:hypothetical protein